MSELGLAAMGKVSLCLGIPKHFQVGATLMAYL